MRHVVAAFATLLAACNADLFHSTDWPTRCAQADGCPDGGSGGHGGTSGAGPGGATSTATITTSTASFGAGGQGGGPVCGNGVVESGEQCDPGSTPNPGCVGCLVICSGVGEHEDSGTFHCYRDVEGTPRSWADARSDCASWGGDLAAPSSAAENAFVASFVTGPSYTGGTDAASEGTFVWANGETWSYTNWNTGEPNNSNGIENCTEIFVGGLWNDLDCATLLPYICERAP